MWLRVAQQAVKEIPVLEDAEEEAEIIEWPIAGQCTVRCEFKRANGSTVVTYATPTQCRVGFLRVEVVQKFSRISHIRLPSGESLHVENCLLDAD
jgi:hypothetical protein